MASDYRAPSADADGAWHRLHPASLILGLLGLGRTLLIPAVAMLLFAREGRWQAWLAILFVPAAFLQVIRYLTLRYRFERDEMIVREGLIFRSERHIPFRRIQNIDLVQDVLHRALRVADVRIETAGGGEPEAVLKVLSLDAVETMRRRVFAEHGERAGAELSRLRDKVSEAGEGELLVSLPTVELVKLGLIAIRGFALLAVLSGALWEFDLGDAARDRIEQWLLQTGRQIEQLSPEIKGAPAELETLRSWRNRIPWIAIASIFIGVPVILLLSIAWTILLLHDFRLVRVGDDLRWSCGLLTRRTATVPRRRIQFISVRESVLHRPFRRVSISIETAAGGAPREQGDGEPSLTQRWFVPLLPKNDLARVLAAIQPGLSAEPQAWERVSPRAKPRAIRKAAVSCLIAAAVAALLWHPWGAVSIIFTPFLIWHAVASVRFMAYARPAGSVLFRSGVLTRRWSAAIDRKIQIVSMHASPFDRRWKMASVIVDTAGAGPAGHRIHVPYLDRDAAEALREELYQRSSASGMKW